MLMRGICTDAIYGENGRHQDLGPHGEPIMTPRMEVHGKVTSLLSFSPFQSSPPPTSSPKPTSFLQGPIRLRTPRPPLLRQRQTQRLVPLPPHLRPPHLHPHRQHLHRHRRRLGDLLLLHPRPAVHARQRAVDDAVHGSGALLHQPRARLLHEQHLRLRPRSHRPRPTDPVAVEPEVEPAEEVCGRGHVCPGWGVSFFPLFSPPFFDRKNH